MTRRLLPPDGSPELQKLIEVYPTASREWIEKTSKELGYKSSANFADCMWKRTGTRREQPATSLSQVGELDDLETKVLKIVQAGRVSVSEISRQVDRSSETVIKTVDNLREKHYEVTIDEVAHQVYLPYEPSKEFAPTEFKYFRKTYRIGLAGDTQIGSKYQQMTLLHDTYSIFDNRQTDFNLHPGDVFDGVDMYRGHRDELFLYDAEQQREYAVKNYPKSKRGTKTYLIGGQHDYSFMKQNGYNILEHLCEKRKDLVYRGFYSAEFTIKGLRIGLEHPGGGIAYALSYAIQKFIEDLSGYVLTRIRNKPEELKLLPAAVFFGHYHKAMHLPYYMGIDAVGMPCFQSRTKYLQQKRHHPDVGCAIAEITLDQDNNLSSTKVEFILMNSQIKERDY